MHESLSVVDLENSVPIHGEGNSLEEPQRITENLDEAKQRKMNEDQLGFLGLSGRTEMREEGRQAGRLGKSFSYGLVICVPPTPILY